MVNVTRTNLLERAKFDKYIVKIYQSNRLTNLVQLEQELTHRLIACLGVDNLLTSNGTLAIHVAYKALGL